LNEFAMNLDLLRSLSAELQKQRRMLLEQVAANDESFEKITDTRQSELEEHAQEEPLATVLERLDKREQIEFVISMARLRVLRPGFMVDVKVVDGRSKRIDCMRFRSQRSAWCVQANCWIKGPSNRKISRKPGLCLPIWTVLTTMTCKSIYSSFVREDGQVDTEELKIVARRGWSIWKEPRGATRNTTCFLAF
jgi:hypothetical protein